MTLTLGGNIYLSGFQDVDPAQLVVLKKIVGHFVRQLNEKGTVEQLSLTLLSFDPSHVALQGSLVFAGNEVHASHDDYNLFFALDKVLYQLYHV